MVQEFINLLVPVLQDTKGKKIKQKNLPNLSAKSQLIAQCGHVIFQQVNQTLEEWVILTLHVCVPGNHTECHRH